MARRLCLLGEVVQSAETEQLSDGGIENTAIVNLWGGSISLNAAAESTPSGGGIFNFGDGKINDVHGNTPNKIAYSL
jgi:hypothetical protein